MGWLGDAIESIFGKPSDADAYNPGLVIGKTAPNMQIGLIVIVNEGKSIDIYDDAGKKQNGTWVNTNDTGLFSIPFKWDPAFATGNVMNTSPCFATLLVADKSGLGAFKRYIVTIGLVTNLKDFIEKGYTTDLSSAATGGLFKKVLELANKFIKENPGLQGIFNILRPKYTTQLYTLFAFVDTTNPETYQTG